MIGVAERGVFALLRLMALRALRGAMLLAINRAKNEINMFMPPAPASPRSWVVAREREEEGPARVSAAARRCVLNSDIEKKVGAFCL